MSFDDSVKARKAAANLSQDEADSVASNINGDHDVPYSPDFSEQKMDTADFDAKVYNYSGWDREDVDQGGHTCDEMEQGRHTFEDLDQGGPASTQTEI